ncbi:FKBP-type peptidyl-prolyl cis-trans isomerase [Kangiella sp. TOML190]|uniref:FKBP-type peptidyl-prolyl cis-trans isomerase n=1 Tax=Kangiella sp. TOML190 TaxID=2931351 RepID=UPI002041A135|nr:FKBP-type peptidyl-prolyl cis-trans isomerase [Kangiella sp. TOML190]
MKKISLVLAMGLALAACKDDKKVEVNKEESKAAEQTVAQKNLELTDLNQKAAYSIGQNFSKQMTSNFGSLKEYGIEIDTALVVQGIKDGFEGKGQFDEKQLAANMQEFQANLQTKMKAQQDKLAAEAKVKAEEAKAAGDAYRAEYAKKDGVKTTESGLMYKVVTKGNGGAKPKVEDTVQVHYKGTFIDGEEFDSSYSRNQPTTFPLGGVIKGWTEGLQLMEVGDKFEFVIPADIAYGEHGSSRIPGNSTLVFEVELLNINPKAEEQM